MDRRSFVVGTVASAATMASGPGRAQDAYPTRAITMISPFPPGGVSDTITRPLDAALEAVFKQPVVLENKAGAAGAVGAQFAASAKPDGYTLLSHIVSISGFAAVDRLFDRKPKFTNVDFIPLARIVADPIVLIASKDASYRTLKDLVADAKANPNKLIYSSSGLYGASHIPTVLFAKSAGNLEMRHLPTNGGGPPGDSRARRQCELLHVADFDRIAAHPRRQSAAARRIERKAHKVAAGRPDVQGAGLPSGILFLGRHFRAEGNANPDRQCPARGAQQGRAQQAIPRHARKSGSGIGVYGPAGVRCILGRRLQTTGRCHKRHWSRARMTSAIVGASMQPGFSFLLTVREFS